MSNLDRLVPAEWRKIAQDDSPSGDPVAAVYYNPENKSFFIQAMQANEQHMTFGPIPNHVMTVLMHIFSDLESMDNRYRNLD